MISMTLPRQRSLPLMLAKALVARGRSETLPPISLSVASVRFDQAAVNEYRAYFGFPCVQPDQTSGLIPITYLFMATQSAQLSLMTNAKLGMTTLGMIHVGVTFSSSVNRPVQTNTSYRFSLALVGQQSTDKGLCFTLRGEFYECSPDGHITNDAEQCAAWYESEYLIPQRQRERRLKTGKVPEEIDYKKLKTLRSFDATAHWARRYARLSGDINPIHLAAVTARCFGYKQPIAHGMAMAAALLAAQASSHQRVSFSFLRPALLPQMLSITDVISPQAGATTMESYLLNAHHRPCVKAVWQ